MPLSIRRDDLLPGRNFIGHWCEAADGRRFDVTDPATDAVFASVPDSGAADAQRRAGRGARHGLRRHGAPRRQSSAAAILKPLARPASWPTRTTWAGLISREQGKPLAEGRGEVAYAASYVDWFAAEATRANGDVIPGACTGPAHVRAEGAGGRGGGDHALELSGRDDRPQDRPRARRRLHRRCQAGRGHAAHLAGPGAPGRRSRPARRACSTS